MAVAGELFRRAKWATHVEYTQGTGFFSSFNHSQSLNNVGKGFRALAAHIGKLFVLAFSYICLKIWSGIFYRCEGLTCEHTGGEVHHTACLVGGDGGTVFHGQDMAADGVNSLDKEREFIFVVDTFSNDAGAGADGIPEDIFTGCRYVAVADLIQNSAVIGGNEILVVVYLFREVCNIEELLDDFKLFVYSEWYAGGVRSKGSELVSEDTFR